MWVAWEMAITCISTVEYHNIRCIFSVFMFCHGFEIIFASSGFLMFLHWIRIYSTRNLSESLIFSSFGKLRWTYLVLKSPAFVWLCLLLETFKTIRKACSECSATGWLIWHVYVIANCRFLGSRWQEYPRKELSKCSAQLRWPYLCRTLQSKVKDRHNFLGNRLL